MPGGACGPIGGAPIYQYQQPVIYPQQQRSPQPARSAAPRPVVAAPKPPVVRGQMSDEPKKLSMPNPETLGIYTMPAKRLTLSMPPPHQVGISNR
jgi:hypothetical protein